ncbi:hypothetical protein E1281_16240 [Actinomadura sp. KC345]|uniref:hypothetical protein n=1 Tax=Actinomadura sp. KC345 TaxID=2530371 RepID=UPI001049CC8C|nr:hypothetical protein [Actinomadura sp. KC345]TDC54467.1 hypothetical protein E1281_16240 [Actinomadura sp. KC345]
MTAPVDHPELLRAALAGTLIDLHTRDAPARSAGRTVRAGALTALLTQRTPDGPPLRAVKLRGARITGELDLEAAEPPCPILLADCHFDMPVNLRECTAPAIRLPGCHLPGLTADQMSTTGDLALDGVTVHGTTSLAGARIGGNLSLNAARLTRPDGRALDAEALTVTGNMRCQDGFTAIGEIHLRGATIGGTLTMTGANLNAPGGDALAAARLSVGDDVFCRDLTADGETRVPGARIGGRLDLSRARLTNPGGTALTADRLTVEDGLLAEGLAAEGDVRLPGARINATLVLAGARLSNPGGQALNAADLAVNQDLHATNGFAAEGEVRLPGARIGGHLDLSESTLTAPGRRALDLEGATAAALTLLPRHRPTGDVNLTGARVGTLEDAPATWPTTIRLRGFTYDTLGLHEDTADVRTRIAWLTRDPGGYVPQLYDQLTSVYRRAGDEQAAHKVAVAKQWRRRAELNPAGKLANWLLYLTVGYGYRTWLAAVWLAVLLALGTWIFTETHPHDLTRTDKNAPAFNPFGYTLDVLLPIVDLGQQKAWRAKNAAMYWTWTFTASGWLLTTAVVAGLTGILKRT